MSKPAKRAAFEEERDCAYSVVPNTIQPPIRNERIWTVISREHKAVPSV